MFLLGVLLACEPEVITEYRTRTEYVTETETITETEIITETETVTETEEICGTIEGKQPCDFIVIDENGDEVNFHSLIGKPVILDLSTTWCYPCNQAAAEVQATQDAYPELTYLTILIENDQGIDPEVKDLKDWVVEHRITSAPVWAGSREVITDDPTDSDEFYLRSWPTFYFLDEELRIVGYQRGFDQAIIENWAEELLNQE